MGRVGVPQLGQTPHPPGSPLSLAETWGPSNLRAWLWGGSGWIAHERSLLILITDEKGLWGLSQAHLTTVRRQDGVGDSEERRCLPVLLSSVLAPSRDGRA